MQCRAGEPVPGSRTSLRSQRSKSEGCRAEVPVVWERRRAGQTFLLRASARRANSLPGRLIVGQRSRIAGSECWCIAIRDSEKSNLGHPTCKAWEAHSSPGSQFSIVLVIGKTGKQGRERGRGRFLTQPDGETGSCLSYKEMLRVQFLLGRPICGG